MTAPMTTAATTEVVTTGAARVTYAATRDLLAEAAAREVTAFWEASASMDPAAREKATINFMRQLVKRYGDIAGQAAADYLASEWAEWGEPYSSLGYPDTVGPTHGKYVERSTKWAMQTKAAAAGVTVVDDEVLNRLIGMATRAVLAPADKTVAAGARKAGVKFARVAEANACAFCKMLASRGGEYHDSSTAARSHDRCRCSSIQVRSDSELPASSQRYMREWAEWADNHDGQPTLEAWAAHQYKKSSA